MPPRAETLATTHRAVDEHSTLVHKGRTAGSLTVPVQEVLELEVGPGRPRAGEGAQNQLSQASARRGIDSPEHVQPRLVVPVLLLGMGEDEPARRRERGASRRGDVRVEGRVRSPSAENVLGPEQTNKCWIRCETTTSRFSSRLRTRSDSTGSRGSARMSWTTESRERKQDAHGSGTGLLRR